MTARSAVFRWAVVAILAASCAELQMPARTQPPAPEPPALESFVPASTPGAAAPADTLPADSPAATTTLPSTPVATTGPTVAAAPVPAQPAAGDEAGADRLVAIPVRFERRVDDLLTADFVSVAKAVLRDPRGWEQAGFRFEFDDPDAKYTVVLAEGPEVDRLCAPYRTGGRFSCQIGPVVALNADRWRTATASWPLSIPEYRTMLVNHEVGHLLGQHHPARFCGSAGEAAAVMAQQSKGVGDCAANPWPLPWEIACASRHEEELAPPYEVDIELSCGPADVAASLED